MGLELTYFTAWNFGLENRQRIMPVRDRLVVGGEILQVQDGLDGIEVERRARSEEGTEAGDVVRLVDPEEAQAARQRIENLFLNLPKRKNPE